MKNFRLVTLLTVFTILLNFFSVLLLLEKDYALSDLTATFQRLKASTSAGNVVVAFTTTGTGAVIEFPVDFTGTGATATTNCSVTAPDWATSHSITCAGLTIGAQSVVVTGLTNPVSGTYNITVTADATTLSTQVPIVDSDEVTVTGYILSSMIFDLDSNTDNTDCAYNACRIHGDPTAAAGGNYTVDLGNLIPGAVNKSGTTALHSDGKNGLVNNIYFDLSTNATNGAVVTMLSVGSAPGYLNGPGTSAQDIPSVTDGDSIVAGTPGYGYKWFNAPTAVAYGAGHVETLNASCSSLVGTYCAIPTTSTSIWESNTVAQEVRGYLQIAAAIDGTMVPGTYTDTLRFIATSTY